MIAQEHIRNKQKLMRMPLTQTIKDYYSLTKPGVLYGNVLTAIAGFLLASAGVIDVWLMVATVIGTTLVIGSACTVNNYLDQDIDSHMERTKTRALVQKRIPPLRALVFGIVLCVLGMVMLTLWTNLLVVAIGATGFITYVWLYGALSKRKSVHGTLVGSVSGALPILAGYVAVTGQIDAGAVIVFAVLFFWQMPEFYSIAIYRRKEYKAAGVPVISVVRGVERTKREIVVYTVLYVAATLLLTAYGYTGITYLVVMGGLGLYWIWLGVQGLHTKQSEAWARKMFRFAMIMILALCVMLSVGPVLP